MSNIADKTAFCVCVNISLKCVLTKCCHGKCVVFLNLAIICMIYPLKGPKSSSTFRAQFVASLTVLQKNKLAMLGEMIEFKILVFGALATLYPVRGPAPQPEVLPVLLGKGA